MTENGTCTNDTERSKEENDDWSARSQIWGEEFCITLRTVGNEATGDVPHQRVYHAVENYLLMEDHSFEPGDRPDSPDDLPQMPKKSRRYSIGEAIVTLWLEASNGLVEAEFSELDSVAQDAIPVDFEVMG